MICGYSSCLASKLANLNESAAVAAELVPDSLVALDWGPVAANPRRWVTRPQAKSE